MRWLVSLGLAATVIGVTAAAGAPQTTSTGAAAPMQQTAQDGDTVAVMTRNLYLGADIGPALDLLPDLKAAADFLWGQVTQTDFTARSKVLAAEAAQYQPAVIGLQEATKWLCTTSIFASPTAVYDFTEQFLQATADAGTPYVIAAADGEEALNPGYKIGPLPGLTVTDPQTFQPIFGRDSANCGFEIGDALLVRADLAGAVVRVGTSEYEARSTIVPTVLSIDRGYAWADVAIAGTQVRFVTTHLESLWDPDKRPVASQQAEQLVADLAQTTGPLVVMGDFNSDPRDPRPAGAPNPGSQPEGSDACPAQVPDPTPATAQAGCSAYWTMRQGQYTSAGPDDVDPVYYTWGASALLAGPDPQRLVDALAEGNEYGFTDRLDYVFLRNGVTAVSAEPVGDVWPQGDSNWVCDNPDQIANTEQAGAILAADGLPAPQPGAGVCFSTDHVGIVATLRVDPVGSVADDPPPIDHEPFRLVWWHIALVLLVAIIGLVWWLVHRRRTRKRAQAAAAATSAQSAD